MTDSTIESAADKAAASGDFAGARTILERAVATEEASASLWIKLAAARNAAGDLRAALDAVERGLALEPLEFSALLYRATLLDRLGDGRAGQEYGHALAQAPPDDKIPPAMRGALEQARSRWTAHQDSVEAKLAAALPGGAGPEEQRRISRFISNRSRRTRTFHQQPTDFEYPGLPEIELHDTGQFAGIAELEAATDVICEEFEALVAAEAAEIEPYIQYSQTVPLRQWRELNRSDRWSAIHLLRNGERVEPHAGHCPRTLEVLKALAQPRIRGASPNAMFSLLAPKTRIPAHTGVANTRLVCHLPLIVPPGCGFRCGDSVTQWTMGKAFIFDDTIEHEAWNDSDRLRVVLIVDLWAPSLSAAEREAVTAVIEASGVTFMGA